MFRKYEKTPRVAVPNYPEKMGKLYLSDKETKDLFKSKLVVTEKMDGANTGIIRTKDGFRLQKRGSLVDVSEHDQFNYYKAWSSNNHEKLMKIPRGYIIYGELMRCVHTIYYNKLPDWFLVFAIYDTKKEEYKEWSSVLDLCFETGLSTVPVIGCDHWRRDLLVKECMPIISTYGEEEAEGIVLYSYTQQKFAKIVKPQFYKRFEDEEHWTNQALRYNNVISDSSKSGLTTELS